MRNPERLEELVGKSDSQVRKMNFEHNEPPATHNQRPVTSRMTLQCKQNGCEGTYIADEVFDGSPRIQCFDSGRIVYDTCACN